MRIYTARNNEGELVGYSGFVVAKNWHKGNSLQANQDAVYILPSYRGSNGALIDFSMAQLKAEGVQLMYIAVKTKHDFGSMLERKGFEFTEKVYSKRLDMESN